MRDRKGRIAVITGAGSGIGRALALQLAAEGCHVALADVHAKNLEETQQLCLAQAPDGTRVTVHECDVASEPAVEALRDAVKREHRTEAIHLLFNNAGIGGGGSFINDPRHEWERTFNICWFGVYYGCRAFMPMLMAADAAHIINTSSVNGFWGALGSGVPHTAYATAKFAVKGFSEALINDLRENAPHVKVSVVMPGHIGTSIMQNSMAVLGRNVRELTSEQLKPIRKRAAAMGVPVDNIDDATLRTLFEQRMADFRDKAPTSSAQAAEIILRAVADDRWRVLVGTDAERLDQLVRAEPERAYDADFGAGDAVLGPMLGRRG